MKSNISFGDRTYPVYGFVVFIGLILSFVELFILSKKYKKNFDDIIYVYVFGMLGLLVGSKILYLFTVFPQLLNDIKQKSISGELLVNNYLSAGFVYYGGMIGCLFGVYIAYKLYKLEPIEYDKILIPSYLCFACFGRIGCLFAGCCHGIATNSRFSVVYKDSLIAPHNTPLVPVQLYEALFDFIIMIVFIVLSGRESIKKYMLSIFLISYSVFRFLLEFFRGDEIRGRILFFSISQWISLIILLIVLTRCMLSEKYNIKED